MSNKRKVIAKAYTNKFGQVIEPGEDIFFVGSSYKLTYVKKGTFEGVYTEIRRQPLVDENGRYKYDENRRVIRGEPEEVVIAVGVSYPTVQADYGYVDGKYRKIGERNVVRRSYLPLKRVFKSSITMDEFVENTVF